MPNPDLSMQATAEDLSDERLIDANLKAQPKFEDKIATHLRGSAMQNPNSPTQVTAEDPFDEAIDDAPDLEEQPQFEDKLTMHRPAAHGRWAVQIPATLVALTGLLDVWSAVTPGLPQRLQILWDLLPFDARHVSHVAAALSGFALLLLAQGVWRRKRASWALALTILVLSAVAHLLKGLDYEEALVAVTMSVWLWTQRHSFFARSDRPSVRRGFQILAAAFAFTLFYGTLGFYLLDEHFSVNFSAPAALRQTIAMFTSFSNPGLEPIRGFGQHFADSIYIIAAATLGYALISILQPVVLRPAAPAEEKRRAHAIVEEYGDDGVAFLTLLDDKSYWFSPSGSVVAYVVVGRVAVAMGDPIGPAGDKGAAITGWVNFCHRNDWRPAFYEIYDRNLEHHRANGLNVLRIAHEATVDVQNFSLAGGSNKGLRSTVNSARNRGLSTKMHAPPLSDGLLHTLREVSDEWLTAMHGGEKTFSLGAFEDDYIRSCPVMTVSENDRIVAFANIVNCYHSTETTIDLMRRVHESPPGTMELLFISLFEWAKEQGFKDFNLGACPFSGVGNEPSDPPTEKAIRFIYEHVDQFYNFKGLRAFKEKFRPDWRPLYLSYDGAGGLPLVATAVIRADSGQSTWWEFLRHLHGEAE